VRGYMSVLSARVSLSNVLSQDSARLRPNDRVISGKKLRWLGGNVGSIVQKTPYLLRCTNLLREYCFT
jgi:hypothetical protein